LLKEVKAHGDELIEKRTETFKDKAELSGDFTFLINKVEKLKPSEQRAEA
jgi:hypothetical protein